MIDVKTFFDKKTFTLTYVVFDPESYDCVIIDPVWDFDPVASKLDTHSTAKVIEFVESNNLTVHYILETHAHADHISGAQILKKAFPNAKTAIGEKIKAVQETFKQIFEFGDEFKTDGSQFDRLLKDNESFNAGTIGIKVLFTPGHTPACASYVIEDSVFAGDAIFMPDGGTGRCDFPKGSAENLYDSITERLYTLPDSTKVYVGHDYQPNGRELQYISTIKEQKANNIQLPHGRSKSEFIDFRSTRDKSLNLPKLIFQSVQVNANGGRVVVKTNKNTFLKIPISL